ncbi:MAG: HAD hydrolase-like protein, partial [Oscillospiraceae bacterium]|nr:HAD hydrolase-like protein [Oscillospiraceae bacterium]
DLTAPAENGIIPATRALVSPIEMTTGKNAYYVGKPNPLMMRHALKKLDCHRVDAAIIGDRMDTDIVAGIESELDTVLVLSGVSDMNTINSFPYRPKYILRDVGEIAGIQD